MNIETDRIKAKYLAGQRRELENAQMPRQAWLGRLVVACYLFAPVSRITRVLLIHAKRGSPSGDH